MLQRYLPAFFPVELVQVLHYVLQLQETGSKWLYLYHEEKLFHTPSAWEDPLYLRSTWTGGIFSLEVAKVQQTSNRLRSLVLEEAYRWWPLERTMRRTLWLESSPCESVGAIWGINIASWVISSLKHVQEVLVDSLKLWDTDVLSSSLRTWHPLDRPLLLPVMKQGFCCHDLQPYLVWAKRNIPTGRDVRPPV